MREMMKISSTLKDLKGMCHITIWFTGVAPVKHRWILKNDDDYHTLNHVVTLITAVMPDAISLLEQINMA